MSYNTKEVIEMLSDVKQELIDGSEKTFCACQFVQNQTALDMLNSNLYTNEYEYLSLVDVTEGDYALAVSKLNENQENCTRIGIVKVIKVYTEDVQSHPAVRSNKTGFIIEKLDFPQALVGRMEERKARKSLQDEIFARIKLVQQNMMLEELAGRDERLRDLLAEFSERFPGKHLMIGRNH